MSLDSEVRDVCGNLMSNRPSERRKAAESLKKYLETGKAVPSLLTKNTKKKSGYNWNHVFDDINAYVMKETEKYESSKTFKTIIVPLCTNLLHLCVAGANNGCAYIRCEKLTEACLHILMDKRLCNAIGDAYLTLLYKHILTKDYYLSFISPTTWESLLDVCLSACLSNTTLDSVIKLKLLWLVIKNATSYCQFVIPLRNVLSKIKEYYTKDTNDNKIQKIEIVNLILEMLSTECRLSTCEFIEAVLPSIFKFYNLNLDQKTKSLLFKLLEMTIMLHHPQGRTNGAEGSLAHNWDIWNKHLNSISEIICSEIALIQKQLDHSIHQCPHFSYVAAAIMYQVFQFSSNINENGEGSSSKRQKVSMNTNKCFKDLIHELDGYNVPWIGIIQSYVKHFGVNVTLEEYILLVRVLEKIITNEVKKINLQDYENLAYITVDTLLSRHINGAQDCAGYVISFWNACVRNSGTTNPFYNAAHTILRTIINMDVLNYHQVEPLFLLYLEERMPVNDCSLRTLTSIFHKYYTNCCSTEKKLKCLTWLVHGKMAELDPLNVKEIFLHIITNKNVVFNTADTEKSNKDHIVYTKLFDTIDKSILFSEFGEQIEDHRASSVKKETEQNKVEINNNIENEVNERLETILKQHMTKMGTQDVDKIVFVKLLHIIVHYFDIIFTYTTVSIQEVETSTLFDLLNDALKQMYTILTDTLKSNKPLTHKITLLKSVQCILHSNYHSTLRSKVRVYIERHCFESITNTLSSDASNDDGEETYEEDCMEISTKSLKINCILLLAEYCRSHECNTDEILRCILDSDIYDFQLNYDLDCAFRCIEILNEPEVDLPPLELTFSLMTDICKDLFRNPVASQRLLKQFLPMLDRIWLNATADTKQNVIIMIKSYLQRGTNGFYPPRTVVLVYECVAKIIKLCSEGNEHEVSFKEVLLENVKGSIHNIRIFSCYLLKMLSSNLSDTDILRYMESLANIFITDTHTSMSLTIVNQDINLIASLIQGFLTLTTFKHKHNLQELLHSRNRCGRGTMGRGKCYKMSVRTESIMADESRNRTSTLLHGFYGLTQAKPCLVHEVIMIVAQRQQESSLVKCMVKKLLILLISEMTAESVEVYLSKHITNILYYWFLKNKHFDEFPTYLFGYENKEVFLERHKKWIVAAEIVWYKKGEVQNSTYLKRVAETQNTSIEAIIEECFCNILTLCLPYIVSEKYKVKMDKIEENVSGSNANRVLQITRFLLKEEKWNNLFVENLGELVFMAACYLSDYNDTREQYHVNIFQKTITFTYSKDIFYAILKYFDEIVDNDIVQFLCDDQPLASLHILFKMCCNIFYEKIFDFKILYLNSYMTFLERVPLGCSSDVILYNFACVNFLHVIRDATEREEVKILVGALGKLLKKIVAHDVNVLQKAVLSKIVSDLTIKKEKGFSTECEALLKYLTVDVKERLKDSGDVVDFISALSQGHDGDSSSEIVTKDGFKEKLELCVASVCNTSVESLKNMRKYLRKNRHFVNVLCDELNFQGFSEDCETSIIHRVIFVLSNIIKSSCDDKMKIEACNCLAEIGAYDIKTLVMVSPANTKKIVNTMPTQYFANLTLKTCSDILFDENLFTCHKVTEVISSILKFPDGKKALDCEDVDKNVLKCLTQSINETEIKFKIDEAKLHLCIEADNWLPRNETHTQWITRITVSLLEIIAAPTNYISSLSELCKTKPSVCTEIMPSLMGLILNVNHSDEVNASIGWQLNRVFTHIWDITSKSDAEGNKLNYDQKMIVQYLLNVVNFVRIQAGHYLLGKFSLSSSYNYLKLCYDKVAWAACAADQHLDAIYYGELWATAQNSDVPPGSPALTSAIDGGQHVQEIFRKCYAFIGEADAVEGCGTGHLNNDEERRRHFIKSGQYVDALQLHDIALARTAVSASTPAAPASALVLHRGVVASMHNAGMHALALQYIRSCPDNETLSDIQYDCMSYLGDWSSFVDTKKLRGKLLEPTCQPISILKAYRYTCLKDCLNIGYSKDFAIRLDEPLDGAKLAAVKLCENLNMENSQSVYKVVENLHLFRDIEQYYSVRSGKICMSNILSDWNVKKLPKFNDFKHIESLITQRSVILDHAIENYKNFKADIVDLQLQYAELCLSNDRIQMAQRILSLMKDIDKSGRVPLVESQIFWAKSHKDIALSLLLNLISNCNNSAKLSAESIRQYGLWIAECKRENTRDIINKYLEKSLALADRGKDTNTKNRASYDIAKFADEEYKQVEIYMKSQIFENKVKCMRNIKDTAATFRGTQGLTGDERKALATNNAFGELEEAEIANTIAERQSFLILALRYYLLSLINSDDYNLSIFRVVSLWLENPSLDLEDSESGRMVDLMKAIPSWKFLTVLPQLAPRLSNEDTQFAVNLRAIISRCAIEHPHHTLPILFSLKNSDKDKCSQESGRGRGGRASSAGGSGGGGEARIAAASALVAELPARCEALVPVLAQMERLCDATISFAYLTPNKREQTQMVPRSEPLSALRQLDAIPVPTHTVPVDRRGDYSAIVTLLYFEKYYELVGGINCPKKISCFCSDGKKRILLIKGQDDLRQDAMMQQVFNIVNTLLEKNPITNRSKLYIRTYKVVPMSRQSGVLEWCEGTIPIGAYLVEAHSRLRPRDMSSSAARLKLVECHENKKSNEIKLKVFNSILKNFRPIFHFFFTEHYLDPVTWYERRLAYTRSVATSSMIGYIMGLGDRHVKNILIDKCTAEVIHIDFGIAFDQGKTLRTPETVPFRLTQDIIAGFSCNGVEGTFRRCCEKTLQLLRDHQEMLLTILEVLLCDPLHSWAVSEKKMRENRVQCAEEAPVGALAERALLAVRRKLQGGGGGAGAAVSAEGQAARLLSRAADPANLCRLFPGWQPYL